MVAGVPADDTARGRAAAAEPSRGDLGRSVLSQGVGPPAAAGSDRRALQRVLRLEHHAGERDGLRRRTTGNLRGARVLEAARRGAGRQHRVAGLPRHHDADGDRLARRAVHRGERLPSVQRGVLRPHGPEPQEEPAADHLQPGQPDRPHARGRGARGARRDGGGAEERHSARRSLRDVPPVERGQRHPVCQGPRRQQRVSRGCMHQGAAVSRHPHRLDHREQEERRDARQLLELSRGHGVVGSHGAGHQGHRVRHGNRLGVDDAQAAAEAVDVDAVGDLEDVGHIVADQDHRGAAGS